MIMEVFKNAVATLVDPLASDWVIISLCNEARDWLVTITYAINNNIINYLYSPQYWLLSQHY